MAKKNERTENGVEVPKKFKLKRRVILPTLSLQVGQQRILRFDDVIKQSKVVDPDPAKRNEKPADVAPVTDMESGEQMLLLVPAVMYAAIARDYGEVGDDDRIIEGTETYVGKIFGVQKMPKRPGKRYFDIELVEMEADD